jgi:L-fuconolactonase
MKIDSHHHFWHYSKEEFDWIDDSMAVIRKSFLVEDLATAISEAGIDKVISVQARQELVENDFLLEQAANSDFIAGVVGWLPLADEKALDLALQKYGSEDKFVGCRHIVQGEANDDFILGADFNKGVDTVLSSELSYDILILERHLPQTISFADRHDGQRLIVDHIAKPKIAAAEIEPWKKNMFELAKREHVYCKLSGVVTEADFTNWTEQDLRPYMDIAIEAFGPKRLMFGSDWPVQLVGMGYSEWVKLVSQTITHWSKGEQEAFWSQNAIDSYQLKDL